MSESIIIEAFTPPYSPCAGKILNQIRDVKFNVEMEKQLTIVRNMIQDEDIFDYNNDANPNLPSYESIAFISNIFDNYSAHDAYRFFLNIFPRVRIDLTKFRKLRKLWYHINLNILDRFAMVYFERIKRKIHADDYLKLLSKSRR